MPLYEYECEACGRRFEKIQKFSDPLVDTCPKCAGKVHKMFSSPAIQFKGSGFYITDYGKKDSGPAGKTDKSHSGDKAESKSDAKGETGSDSKSESKSDSTSDAKSSSSDTAPASKPKSDS